MKINKLLTFLSLLTISSLTGLFGSSAESTESPSTLRTIPILEVSGDSMPGWEKQIIERYHDEEGDPIPVVFRGAAKNWEAASWTPEWFAEQFGDKEIIVVPQKVLEEGLEENTEDPKMIDTSYKELNENLICEDNETRLQTCDKEGLNCRYECLICNENHHCHPSKKENNEADTKLINTTIQDHITDILLNPKNSAYFLCPLPHNTSKDELNTFDDDDLSKNSIFAYNHLSLSTQTQFPQSIIQLSQSIIQVDNKRTYILFIGSENSVASLHNHPSTFLAQLYGKKIARLVHPQYIEQCYCEEDEDEGEVDGEVELCAIDITAPDFEQYPDLKDIEVYETILEPGDVLYIPDCWLHDIRGLSTSISISSGF